MTFRHRVLTLGVMSVVVAATASLADDAPAHLHKAPQSLPIQLGTSGSLATEARRSTGLGGQCGAFTLGSAVTCNGRLYMLSTNYALGSLDDAGNPAIPGTSVLQPGNRDTNCRADGTPVAVFEADYAPLLHNPAATVDAAIVAALPGAVDPTGAILDIGVICPDPVTATVGMPVALVGRSSGLAHGVVETIQTSVHYGGPGIDANFTNDIVVEGQGQFTRSGDEGALVMTDDASHHPVALLYYPGPSYGFSNPVDHVVAAFDAACHPKGLQWVGRSDCAATAAAAAVEQRGSPAGLDRAAEVKERHAARLLADPAILAVGIGASDNDSGIAAIHIYRSPTRMPKAPLPSDLEGIPVSVRVADAPVRR